MKINNLAALIVLAWALRPCLADDITTLDGHQYANVRDVKAKHNGLFFMADSGGSAKGVTVPYDNLPDDVKEKSYVKSHPQ